MGLHIEEKGKEKESIKKMPQEEEEQQQRKSAHEREWTSGSRVHRNRFSTE